MTEPMESELLTIHRPQDGVPVGSVKVDGVGEVRAAVARVRSAQRGWASLSVKDRVRHMGTLRACITRRADEIADRIVAETGKPQVEALSEVTVGVALMRYYERRASRILEPRRVPLGWMRTKRARLGREPYGVVAVVGPWNYPFILTAEPTVTALFGGNGVVVKPSEHSPFTGAILPELVAEADLPSGLVQVVQGGPETGEALVASGVDRIHVTGSPATGRRVLAAAAPRLIPVSLELGAKDAALVLEDADLERTARGIAFGGLYNAGQTCLAVERVYVVEEVYEAFLRKLVGVVTGLRAGAGGRADVGPMVLASHLQRVEEQLEDAVELGARVLCGGHRLDPASNVFLPTVIADVNEKMRIMREETFGPLVPVTPVADEDEAVERANAHPMALCASVWTGDRERGAAVAGRLRCGGASVNDVLSHWAIPALPMGGAGESGFSRVRGDEGLRSFTRTRFLLEDRTGWKRDPWWFPYGERGDRLVRALLAWEGETGVRRWSRALGALLGRREP
jgi:acyl-CoA reductase-like NAD-dependent aldehyde dehydrogenase